MRRELLGLPPLPFWGPSAQQLECTPLYYAYSPTVIPRPVDWADRIHVTGFWFSDPPPGWTPPPDLVAFLESGPPPVYVGFGSMPSGSPGGHAEVDPEGVGLVTSARHLAVMLAGHRR